MKILGVVPARYASTRFPGKPLTRILDKPMIVWVMESVALALGKENSIAATDDMRIADVVTSYGYKAIMTSDQALTGTDRIAEVAQKMFADIYVNVQGDEPLLDPNDIRAVVNAKVANPRYIINAMKPLSEKEDPADQTIPKVVFSKNNHLIYMSRLPIPGIKDSDKHTPKYWKQVCIYAFSGIELAAFATTGNKAYFEKYEDIEILRFLDLGFQIKMVEVKNQTIAVDLPEHVPLVESELKKLRF